MDSSTKRAAALGRQVRHIEKQLIVQRELADRLSLLRLLIFGIGGLASLAALAVSGVGLFFLISVPTLVGFGFAVRAHRRARHRSARLTIWRRIKLAQVARIDLYWEHIPAPPDVAPIPDHPFEIDLDITGTRSVHHLLDTAASAEGSARLKRWLLNTRPDRQTILDRQALVGELIPLPLFRDKLTLSARLSAHNLTDQWNGSKLLTWLNSKESAPIPQSLLMALCLLAAGNILSGLINLLTPIPPILRAILFAAYALLYIVHLKDIRDLFEDALMLQDALRSLGGVFQHLETYRYGNHSRLAELCAPFRDSQNRPSAQLRRVSGIVAAASLQGNMIVWLLLNALLPWDMLVAYRLTRAKGELQSLLPGWLEVWHELEALSSLANFAYLNPEQVFPEVTDSAPLFIGQQLGHPLIRREQKVCNDFTLDTLGEVIIITGSNMAGKSSFLRTLGVNLCLAYAGTTIDGRRLQTPLFRLFTCIKVADSVTEGFSYFYAEVRRLKALLMALEKMDDLPLFYLIDEIFRGTNNRERLIGSRSYIRALVGKRGTGIISTHDLELVRLADEMSLIHNYHFREDVVDGQMVFDYRLRPGPSPTTNALKIMALEGLPIETTE